MSRKLELDLDIVSARLALYIASCEPFIHAFSRGEAKERGEQALKCGCGPECNSTRTTEPIILQRYLESHGTHSGATCSPE
jgi:hypothetical protein